MITDSWNTSEEIENHIGEYIDWTSEHTAIHDLGVAYVQEGKVSGYEAGFAMAEAKVEDYRNK